MIPPYKGQKVNKFVNIELGNSSDYQLYNLAEDIGEQNDLSKQHPEILKELQELYTEISDEMMDPQWGWQQEYSGDYKKER
jgi:hypothetical protein